MLDRREFIARGAAFGVLPLAGPWAESAEAVRPRTGAATADIDRPGHSIDWPGFCKVVYDERFEPARSFASRANEYGARLHAISGDITDLWFNDLHRRWRTGPALLAGLTLESSAAQLGYFARDQRHVIRYPNRVAADGTGFGLSEPTALLSESMTPIRLVSWIIEPRDGDAGSARPGPFRFPVF